MEISNLIPHIEALIFASDKPLTVAEVTELLNQAFGFMEDKLEAEQIEAALEAVVEKYNSEFYPFEVKQSGGGWQFLTKKEFHKTVAQLNGEKFLKRLSAAALETLAIVAYKQPVTKGEIEAIRGVSSDYAVQKLLEKELIVISGRNEKLPGHPLIYNTSKNFMDYFGINSPEDLPKIREVLSSQVIEPTVIHHTDFGEVEASAEEKSGTTASEEVEENNIASTAQLSEDQSTEDLPTEEAIEEYLTDELFIEADEKEQQILEEEVIEEMDATTSAEDSQLENFLPSDEEENTEEEKG
jgi:segregation and condensation protein B